MAANIAVKDRGTAEAWIAKANALNQRAKEANEMVSALLRQLDEGAAGEAVVKLVQFGNQMLTFAQQIYEGVTQICNAISGVIDLVAETVSNVVSAISSIAGRLSN